LAIDKLDIPSLRIKIIIPAEMTAFTVVNGQIYTPGLAIVDAPQPSTPLGGGKSHYLII
jgi:hypothetical protein